MKKLLLYLYIALGSPPYVIDGDTIGVRNIHIRLVDYNAPEISADCAFERDLAIRAKLELARVIRSLEIEVVSCATHNWGRLCARAFFRDDGRPLSTHMTRLGLAEPYLCGAYSCPIRKSWCSHGPLPF